MDDLAEWKKKNERGKKRKMDDLAERIGKNDG